MAATTKEVQVTIRLTADQVETIQKIADKEERKLAAMMRLLLGEAVARRRKLARRKRAERARQKRESDIIDAANEDARIKVPAEN